LNKSGLDFSTLTKIKPERSLTVANQKEETIEEESTTTRKVAVMRCYRLIDFKRNKYDSIGKVVSIE
jgi:ribosomal protein L2